MDGMRRGLRLIYLCILVPTALASLLVLVVLAALWYYVRSLAYLAQLLWPRSRKTSEPALGRPHLADRPASRRTRVS